MATLVLVPRVGAGPYLGLITVLLASSAASASKAEELEHRLYHDSDYRHWKQPGTDMSCCSDQDCAPVRAEFRQGQWFAFRQSELFQVDEMGQAVWQMSERAEWIAVPNERIIRVPNPSVESGHLCYLHGKVVCFVPPNTGS